MDRAKRSLLLAISLSVFMSLVAVQSLPAQTKVIRTASPSLMDETLPLDDDARWDDGFGFSTVNQLPFVVVRAIAVNSSGLYVGGNTLPFFDLPVVNGIARWDGNSWSEVSGGVGLCPGICNGAVYALEAKGDDLYVGGNFSYAGGVRADRIARWDGDGWHAVGSGANGPVYKIAFNGDDIYVGGDFTSIDGVKANGVARFDGTNWHALGSGVRGRVHAIAFKDNEVYVGGRFNTAGGKTAYNFARWVGPAVVAPPPPPPVLLPKITGISISRKKLIVAGELFERGASILLNGERQNTKNDEQNPTTVLIAKKSGKKARPGDKLRVQNPDGKLSPEFIITQ